MNRVLIFDSETAKKLPNWSDPSDSPDQLHMVQLAAKLVDADTRKTIQSMNVIIKPDGWVIEDGTIEVHGITNEFAAEVGIAEIDALRMFMHLWSKCDLRIAHNTTFDNRVIWIALCRYCKALETEEVWAEKKALWKGKGKYYCTYQGFKKLIGGKSGHKLQDAYKWATGDMLVGGHNAMVDVEACQTVYFAIMDRQEG